MQLPTEQDILDLYNDNNYNWEVRCSKCGKKWGSHSIVLVKQRFHCPISNGQPCLIGYFGWSIETFMPTIDAKTGDWIEIKGAPWPNPLKAKASSNNAKFDLSPIYKPKIYKHECPCGLIVCDYHMVEK